VRITLGKVFAVIVILAMVAGLRYMDKQGMFVPPDVPTVEFGR